MSDRKILVEDDGCQNENEKFNGVLINVEPCNGVENLGFKEEPPRKDYNERNKDNNGDFIMAIFVVVFDTKRGESQTRLQIKSLKI